MTFFERCEAILTSAEPRSSLPVNPGLRNQSRRKSRRAQLHCQTFQYRNAQGQDRSGVDDKDRATHGAAPSRCCTSVAVEANPNFQWRRRILLLLGRTSKGVLPAVFKSTPHTLVRTVRPKFDRLAPSRRTTERNRAARLSGLIRRSRGNVGKNSRHHWKIMKG